ncbi:acyltransferase family protein [Streptomyces sp. NPDC093084]|uniref:acyltransferase family protein n=1 Tax=Streptomyces sp. NPDC093084 TaxID=3155197 RepID=UPI003429FB62
MSHASTLSTTPGDPRDRVPAAGSGPLPEPRHGGPQPSGPGAGSLLRQDIQGLRGVAVTLVVLAHARIPFLAGGYTGVDVFFVISGFLITCGLLQEARTTGSLSLGRFYARRALRILPSATLVALVTLAGCRFFASKIRYGEFLHDAVASALYCVNIDLAASGTDYLREGASPSPFQHYWSLSVEEQFYLLWPVILLAAFKLVRRRRLRVLPLAALCLLSCVLAARVVGTSPSWAYFGPHTRLWELGAGGLLAFAAPACARLPRAAAEISTWLGLGAVAAAALLYDDSTPFPGPYALLPVGGAVLVVAGGCGASRPLGSRLLALRPATWTGGLSYGWYLWHWPFLVIGPAALTRTATPQLSLGLALAALLPAWLTLRLVENPIRRHRSLRRRPAAALGLGLGLTATVVTASLVAAAFPPPVSSAARAVHLEQALATARDPEGRLTELLGEAATALPRNLSPALTKIKDQRSAVYGDACHVGYAGDRSPACEYGARTSGRVVVLFGDSHAAQWFPALEDLGRRHGWRLVSLTKSSCKTSEVTIVAQNRPYRACDRWRENALARIGHLRPWLVVTSSSEAAKPAHPLREPLRDWQSGYERVYRRLARDADHVLALLDTPWPRVDAVECAAGHPLDLPACEQDQRDAVKAPLLREASRRAAHRTGVALLDPKPWLCPTRGRCPLVVGDTFVYRDESHLAESYAKALTPLFADAVESAAGRTGRDGPVAQ